MPLSHKATTLVILGIGFIVAAAAFGFARFLQTTGELTRTRALLERDTPEDASRQLRAPTSEEPAEALVPLIQGAFGLETPSRPQ